MPLYEFECKSCDQIVELLVRSPSEKAECPECGDDKLNRILSVPASPSIKSDHALPVARGGADCGAPRCCGGGCQM